MFLAEHLTPAFLKKTYKAHRENMLLEREKARLPETQADAVRYRTAKQTLADGEERIRVLKAAMDALPEYARIQRSRPQPPTHLPLAVILHNFKMSSSYHEEITKITRDRPKLLNIVRAFGATHEEEGTPRRYVMRCASSECDGFVGADYKCGLCFAQICKDCHMAKTAAHVCVAEDVASVATLKKESRPCPHCAAPITKIAGCDLMWCSLCKTSYDWQTGRVGIIRDYDAHHVSWTPTHAVAPTVPRSQIRKRIEETLLAYESLYPSYAKAYLKEFTESLRSVEQIRTATIPAFTAAVIRDEANRHKLRVQRLLGEIDDAGWKRSLQIMEKANAKNQQWRELFEMYARRWDEIFTLDSVSDFDTIVEAMSALETVKEHVKKESEKLMKFFDCVRHADFGYLTGDVKKPAGGAGF